MSTVTKIVSEIEFLFDFEWTNVNIFNDYLQDVTLIGLYRDEIPYGLAVIKKQYKLLEIVKICCRDDKKDDWLFCYSVLLEQIEKMSVSLGIPVIFSIVVDHGFFDSIDNLLQDKGFVRDADKQVVTCSTEREAEKRWRDFMKQKGYRIIDRINRRGFVTMPYKKMSEQYKKIACLSVTDEFDVSVDFEQLRMPIDGENSFFTFMGESLIAYCLVFRFSPRQLLFEYTITKKGYTNTGVSMMPIILFCNNAFEYEQIHDVIFTYRVGNREMELLSNRMLSIVIRSKKTRAYYMLRKNGVMNDVL